MPQVIHVNFGYFLMETVQPEPSLRHRGGCDCNFQMAPCDCSFLTATSVTGACWAGQGWESHSTSYTARWQPPCRDLQQRDADPDRLSTEGGGTSQEPTGAFWASISTSTSFLLCWNHFLHSSIPVPASSHSLSSPLISQVLLLSDTLLLLPLRSSMLPLALTGAVSSLPGCPHPTQQHKLCPSHL